MSSLSPSHFCTTPLPSCACTTRLCTVIVCSGGFSAGADRDVSREDVADEWLLLLDSRQLSQRPHGDSISSSPKYFNKYSRRQSKSSAYACIFSNRNAR